MLAYEETDDGRVVLKPVRSFLQAGGKGLNAARTILLMGGDVVALTTQGGIEGRMLLREVKQSGVTVKSVEVSRPTRISTGIYNMTRSKFQELLEPGVDLKQDEVEALFSLFLDSLDEVGIVALSGSSPCKTSDDFFRRASEAAKSAGKMVVVDSYNDSLVNAVEAVPDMVKLNTHEIELSYGYKVSNDNELTMFVGGLLDKGIKHVLVTYGARGARLFSGGRVFSIRVPSIRGIHAIGSGDAMLGALLFRLEQGEALEEACRWGAAAGSVNAGRLEVCQFDAKLVEDLLPSVKLETVEIAPIC